MTRIHPRISRLGCLIICIWLAMAIVFCLGGCAGNMPAVSLEVMGEGVGSYPQLRNLQEESINRQLEAYFGELSALLRRYDTEDSVETLSFALEETREGWRIRSYLCGGGGRLELEAVRLEDGTLMLPGYPDQGLLAEEGFLAGALALEECGVSVCVYGPALANEHQMGGFMVALYEKLAGMEVDTSAVAAEYASREYEKCLVLELPVDDEESYFLGNPDPVRADRLSAATAALVRKLQRDAYGRSGDLVTAAELERMLQLFFSICYAENMESGDGWNRAKMAMQPDGGQEVDHPLSRLELAQRLVALYESHIRPIEKDRWSGELLDTDAPAAQKAMGAWIMRGLPGDRQFSPDYMLHIGELPALTQAFVRTCKIDWDEQNNTADSEQLSYGQLVAAMGRIAGFFEGQGKAGLQHTVVENGRNYEWYYSQMDASVYSAVNCMPANVCMGAKWYDRAFSRTPKELRELYDITTGWSIFQVTQTLDKLEIPYDVKTATKEGILGVLDGGGVALVQFSENNPDQEGHCMLIYGYESYGETLEFLVNDPGYHGDNLYGKPSGSGLRMEADYALLLISNHYDQYVAIPSPE